LRKNPLLWRDDKGNHCLTLKLLQYFYPTSKVVFCNSYKLDFTSGLDPSYKDEILTQGELQPDYAKWNLITGAIPKYWIFRFQNGRWQ
jgi:peptide/nickel transport system substrate-binding protein